MEPERDAILAVMSASINRILVEQGFDPAVIDSDTRLLGNTDLEIDSLDLAVLVTELQEATDADPFADGFIAFSTAGELAQLFADAQARAKG